MSPGKIAKSQSNGEKTPKARQKKEKAVLKTPSIIKVKIKLPSVQQDATQSQNIGNDEAAKSLTEKKTEEQTPSEPPSVQKRGRKKSTSQKATVKSEDALHEVNQPTKKKAVNRQSKVSPVKKISPAKLALESDNAVKAEDAIEEVHQPIKETVVKRGRIKKNKAKQSTDQGSSVENNASLILSSESVVKTDPIEDVKPPVKETVAKKQRVKKNNLKQSTDEGPPVENKTSPVLSSQNADATGAIEEETLPKKKTVVKRQYVKKIKNRAQSVKKVIPANLAIENDNAEGVVEEVLQPDIKKKTTVKRKWVKKNQNSEHIPGDSEPVKKKARTKLIPEDNNTVKSEDTTTEVTEPVKKQKKVIKKRVKKVQNRKQTASKGAKKKAPPHKENSPLAPESDNVVQTEGSQGASKVDDNEPDKLKLNEHFYDILRANQVITALFPRKQKSVTNSPTQHTLPVDTNTPKKKAVVTKAVVSKKPDSNGKLVIKKNPTKVRTQGKKKPAQTKKCVSVRSKKVLKPKACKKTNICSSSTKAREKKIETTEIEKPLIKQNGNSSPKTEIVKAGPESQKLNEIIGHTKNEDTDIDNNISVTCKPNRRASRASSNISWVKDISTSSFSSFVTVNDFYVFDNKIPVLPLKPVDNELTNIKRKPNFSVNNSNKCSKNLVMNRNMKAHDLLSTSSPKTDVTKLPNEPDRNQNFVDMAEKNIAEIVATHPPVNLSSSSSSSSSTSSSISSSSSSDDSSTAAVVSKSKDRKTLEIISRMKTTVLPKLNINKLELSPGINVEREYSNVNKVDLKNVQDKLKDLKGEIEIRRLCQAIVELEMEDVEKYFNHNGRQETTASRSVTPETYSQGALHERDNNSKEYFNETIDNNEKRSSTDKDEAVANDEIAEKIDSITLDQNIAYPSTESYPSKDSYPSMKEKVRVSNEIAEKIMNNSSDRNKSTCSAYIDNDDDDALSIYADSITDLESSRKSTFHCETTDEYVPVPVVPRKAQPISYHPSKITFNHSEHETIKCASICEKQNAQPVNISTTDSKGEANECTDTYEGHNADSTSLLFDSDSILDVRGGSFINEDRIGDFAQYPSKTNDVTNTQATSEPRLMASIHKPSKIRSQVFKDFCIFFLKNVCKNPNCKFPHVYPFVNDVKNMLSRISEDTFIQEYMCMRWYSKLRRKYILCFIAEAIRRDLPRIVVEMAIDCVVKCYPHSVIDRGIKSEALEMILVYLNEVDLSTCEDLLRYAVQANDQNSVFLCDVFMSTIATSQNFTRFKQVFISLTDFMCRNGRPFSVDVAEALLERLCILPYDATLARALMNILKKTDVTLFSNNKIQYLERQLVTSNNDLYLELKSLKNKALVMQPVLGNQYDHVYEPSTVSVDKRNSSLGNEQTIKPLMQNTDEINTHFGNKHTVNTPNKVNSSFGYGQSFQPLKSNEDERQTFETRNEIIRNDAADFGNKNKPFETKFKMTFDLNKLKQSGFLKNENIAGHRDSSANPFVNRVLSVGENTKFNGALRDDNIRNHSMIRPSNLGIGVKGNANQGKQGGLKNQFAIYQNTFPRAPGAPQLRYPRPPYKRRLDRSFAEGGAPKFPRNNGPGHFQRDMS